MSSGALRLAEGRMLGGYRIESLLGSGGQASVYRAKQVSLGRPVALKVMSRRGAVAGEDRRRFLQEGRLAGRVSHPRIVTVFEVGEEDDFLFLAYDLADGPALRERLQKELRLAPSEAASIAEGMADALQAVHEAGILHRDVKPENIFLDRRRGALLGDLGCGKDLTLSMGQTQAGHIVGTPAYMAPESVLLKPLTNASDLYSLGIVFYECLAGHTPFVNQDASALLYMHVTNPVPSLSDRIPGMPKGIDAFFQQALAKDPDRRFQSGKEFRKELRLAMGKSLPARTPSHAMAPVRPAPAPTGKAPYVAAAVLGVGLLAAGAGWRMRPKAPEPVPLEVAAPAPAPAPRPADTSGQAFARAFEKLRALAADGVRSHRRYRSEPLGALKPEGVRRALSTSWKDALAPVTPLLREALRGRGGREELAGRLLVDAWRVARLSNSCIRWILDDERNRANSDALVLLGFARREAQQLELQKELAATAGAVVRDLAAPGAGAPPWLTAGWIAMAALSRWELRSPAQVAALREAAVAAARVAWPALVTRGRDEERDPDAASAVLDALQHLGAEEEAVELARRARTGYETVARPRDVLMRYDLEDRILDITIKEGNLGTGRSDLERGLEEWTRLQGWLQASWLSRIGEPWYLKKDAAGPGSPGSLEADAGERLERARHHIATTRDKLGLPEK